MQLTRPFAKYPHVRRVGDLYFLAGQGCRDPEADVYAGLELSEDGKVLSYDIAKQVQGVFRNIDRALQSVGLNKAALLDVTVFLVNMERDFSLMNQVWDEYFSDVTIPPARTTVGVRCLPGFNYVEMKALATAGQGTLKA